VPVPRKIRCKVSSIIDHGDHVYSVFLISEDRIPKFLPGQFLHLALDAYDPSSFWPDSRVFSIASSPSDRQNLRITYSVKGKYTSRMEKDLKEGVEVWVKLPYGDFVINQARDVVLFAGGTGITAFTAFLNQIEEGKKESIHLFYGARSQDLLIYKSFIEKKRIEYSNLDARYYIENGIPRTEQTITGMLSVDSAFNIIDEPNKKEFYLSGPPGMLQALQTDLIKRSIPYENIKIDAWE
jgi:ferredoxin-NADP reductase